MVPGLLGGPARLGGVGFRHGAGPLQRLGQERVGLGARRPLIPIEAHNPDAVMDRPKIRDTADNLQRRRAPLPSIPVAGRNAAQLSQRGGVIQGVSFALFERRTMDRQEGRMVNADMESYKILGASDCPEIDVVMLDVYNGKNNTATMGLGEPPIVATVE